MALLVLLRCDEGQLFGSGSSLPVCDNNFLCDCSSAVLSPVCSSTGQSFFSACHAGCSNITYKAMGSESYFFSNCSCIGDGIALASECSRECSNKVPYLLLVAFGKFCLSVEIVAGLLFVLRCVEPRDKTLSTGFLCAFMAITTFIPCPLVMSAVVDSTCSVWGQQCDRRGACEAYDMDQFRGVLHITAFLFLLGAAFWDAMFWWCGKDKVLLFDDDEETETPIPESK